MAAIAIPFLLTAGQKCVTRMAKIARHDRSRSGYYRFLSDGKWRMNSFFKCLFDIIVQAFALKKITLVLDDTLRPKWGKKIFATGNFYDHTARPRPGYIWGHNWVVLAIVVRLGGLGYVALPFWVSLYRSEDGCPPEKFKTRHQLAQEGLRLARSWFSGAITLLADGAYNNKRISDAAAELKMTFISRLRSDARLRKPKPPERKNGIRGRKPKHGPWLPKLSALACRTSEFRTETVDIYGKTVTLLVREIIAYWPAVDKILKVVITRDPKRPKRVAYLSSTDISMSAKQVVESFAQRWTIEQLFSVAKNQMGFDSAEVRKERSVVRHAALCMAMITFVEVWAKKCGGRLSHGTFSVKLAKAREDAVEETIFASGPRRKGRRQIAKAARELFSTAMCAA